MTDRWSIQRISGAIDGAGRTLRRAFADRENRVRLYDEHGHAATLDIADEPARTVLEEAAAMIDVVDSAGPKPIRAQGRGTDPQ
ncbi:MAG: hypothetical protein WCK06_00500 [Actinomycetota bacterium]